MERSTWSDERLDDLAARGESQFELLRAELRDARNEMHGMRAEFRDFRAELRQLRSDMHSELVTVRRDMFHGAIAIFGSQVAIFAVLLAQSL